MLRILRDILLATWNGIFSHRLTSMAAGIAFYTIFSLGPILIVARALAEPVLGRLVAEQSILNRLVDVIGVDAVDLLRRALERELIAGESWWATIFGICALLYAGTAIFVELDSALAVIWRDERTPRLHPVHAEIRTRVLAFLLMMVIGIVLLAVVLGGAAISAYGSVLEHFPLIGDWLGPALSRGWTLMITGGFFALIYKFLPDAHRSWLYALIPAAAVTLLLDLGNNAIAWYLAYTKLGSTLGAAGALAGVMVWIYYSAIIVLLAAQISRATRDALERPPPETDAS